MFKLSSSSQRHASLADRFGRAAKHAVMLVTLSLGTLSFLFSLFLLVDHARGFRDHAAELFAQRLELRLQTLIHRLEGYANASMFANALMDSGALDVHVRTFIQEQVDAKAGETLLLADFSGVPIIGSGVQSLEKPRLDQLQREQSVRRNEPQIELVTANGLAPPRAYIVVGLPIVHPATGGAEGLLEYSAELSHLLGEEFVGGGEPANIHLSSNGRPVIASGHQQLYFGTRISLDVPELLAGLHLEVHTGVTGRQLGRTLGLLAVSYLVLGGIAIFVVASLARNMGQRVALPLESLAREVDRFSESGRFSFDVHDAVLPREVSRLGIGFSRVLNRLRESQGALERRVVERTLALRESEQRWSLAVAGSNDGIWDWLPHSQTLYLSPRWKEMLGYADSELPNSLETWRSHLHPDDVAATMRKVHEHLDGYSEQYEAEFRMRCKDGGYKWILARGRAIRDRDRQPIRMVGSHTDITERRELQSRLIQRDRYQRALLDNFPFLVWLKDKDSRFLAVNQPFADACGRDSSGDVVGKTDLDVWPPELARRYRADDREVLLTLNKKSVEEQIDNQGRLTWFETYKAPVVGADGEVLGTVGFARDVTDRKQAEAIIEERNRQLSTVFQLSPDGLVSFDSEGWLNSANKAFEQITGLLREDVIGINEKQLNDLLRAQCESPDQWVDSSTHLMPQHSVQWILKRPHASIIEVTCMESDEKASHRVLYLRDVTHQVEVDRMKSEFLSAAAHELRTPMASIFGFSELLLHGELDPDQVHEVTETIYRQTKLLISIINELLDLARIEARRGKDFELEDVNLGDLIVDLLPGFSFDQEKWPLDFSVGDKPCVVRADRAKIRQVLVNVIGNAQKYSPDGGPISIRLHAEDAGHPNAVAVEVGDHGVGMETHQLQRIFDRFYRADTSGKIPGSGLGMSIVKEIVDLHGGKVEVMSEPGKGTRVVVWFPSLQTKREGTE